MRGRVLIGGGCVVLVAGVLVGVFVAPASAVGCVVGNPVSPPDVDGDMGADVVVGVPSALNGAGVVDVRGSGSPTVALTAAALGAGTGEGDAFGSAIAIADLDQDGCADLVIAAPGEGQSAVSDGGGGAEGQVHIVFGSRGGVDLSSTITLAHDSSHRDRFGAALVLSKRHDGTRWVHDLFVGAPRATVSGRKLAGEVFRYSIASEPGTRVRATLREVRSQDSPGVPGVAEAGDRFGSVLASTGGGGGVLVGVPDEDVGSAKNAGAAYYLRLDTTTGAPIASQSWSQASPGIVGVPEAGDHFGAAIGSRWSMVAIGVPDEDYGSKADSGMIQTLEWNTSGAVVPGRGFTQDTAGVPGRLEAGDRFGAAVAVGIAFTYTEGTDVAVGVPGEDIGTAVNAGAINLINLKIEYEYSHDGPRLRLLRQGKSLLGAAEAGDRVGSVLGLTLTYSEATTDFRDHLLIGVPGEDLGTDTDAGIVQEPFRSGPALTFSTGRRPGTHYGQVLAIASD